MIRSPWLFAALALPVLPSCREARPRHVILISIDTLRADHLGCYGYSRITSPRIDAFRKDAVLFENAVAQAPSTLPAHASMFTSLLPSHHGGSVANSTGVDPAAPTLTEILKRNGFDTASFNGGIQLDPLYGLDRGFDVYVSSRPSVASAEVLVDAVDRFDHQVSEAIRWIEQRKGRSFFLFLHTYEVHHPYSPDPALLEELEPSYQGPLPNEVSVELLKRINEGTLTIADADLEHVVAAYDAEIRSADRAFGKLVGFLRDRRLYEDSLIVVTSDHGEEFGERGRVGWHGHSLHDELLRVPLLVKLPGGREGGRSVSAQARGIDLAPTILQELSIPIPESFEGASLLPAIGGGAPLPEHAVSEKDVVLPDREASIRTLDWKWTRGRLYHLPSDPLESNDVAPANASEGVTLSRKLQDLLGARPRPAPHRVAPDEELLKKLRSLGYIQ